MYSMQILERLKWTLAEVEKVESEFYYGTDLAVRMVAEELKAFITK